MANYSAIKAAVNAYIKENGRKEITGRILNAVLTATIDSLGKFFQFAGVATPSTDPEDPDQNVCYLAGEPGTYVHFDNITLENEEIALLFYDGTWSKQRMLLGIQEVSASVDANVGTPSVDVSYSEGSLVLTFHNLKGEQGNTGAAAGFGTVGATVDDNIGTPGVSVQTSGPDTAKNLMFTFTNLKGETGVTSVVATMDNTSGTPSCAVSLQNQQLTLAFSGLKGLKGDTGVSADYPITIYNGLDSDATDQALAAAQGKILDGKISQLEAKVDDLEDNFNVESGTNVTITSVSNPIVGYMDLSGREYPTATNYIRTDQVQVIPGDKIILQKNGVDIGERFLTAFLNGSAVAGKGMQNVMEYTVPEGVDSVVMSTPATNVPLGYKLTRVVTSSHIKPDRIPDKSIDTTKISAKAVEYTKLGESVLAKLLPAFRTANLYDEREKIDGKYINNSGAIADATGWAISPLIPVTEGGKYTLSCGTSARNVGFNWLDASGTRLSSDGSIWGTHTAPEGAAFMQFNVAANGSQSTEIMVVNGENALPFVPFIQTKTVYIENFQEAVSDVLNGGKLTITKNGNTLTVATTDGAITAKLENNSGAVYTANPVFNFTGFSFSGLSNTGADDIAPMHILNTTIGANHGQPCKKAKITAHGLDNTAIGTGWTKDGVTFYVMRIVDADNILFLSQNNGTLASPSFTALTAGTIERNGNTLTVESVSDYQLVPALKNHTLKLMLNGYKEVTADGVYSSKTLDVVEEYDIMNPVSTLQKIIARAGQSADPDYDGDSAVRVKNIYRFDERLSVLVIATVMPLQEIKFSDIMFAQAGQTAIGNKNYIPNSLPLGNGNYDFRKPLAVTWSSSVPSLAVTENQMADVNNPVNRFIQYNETHGVGFAIGYLKGFGIGKDLLDYTDTAFEIRNNTGKIYPHGVNSAKVGNTIDEDNIYQAVMYRSPFSFSSLASGRMSMYHFAFDGAEYVFVDYASSVLDNVKVDASLNGKTIEVIEAVNTELVTDIYNDGFLVNSTYVEGETCYIVVKVK